MYFHLEKCKNDIIEEFSPKIPESTLQDEDTSIERVCVSTSIEGALGSVPWGGRSFNYVGIKVPIRVYELNLESSEIVTPIELVKKKYVPDAICYDEHWILNKIKPSNYYYIVVDGYNELTDSYFEPEFYNFLENSSDIKEPEEYYISDACVINNLKYRVIDKEDILLGFKFNIDISEIKDVLNSVENPEEKISYLMQDYMSSNNEVENVLIDGSNLLIETNESEGLYVKDFIETLKATIMELSF